MVSSHHNRGEAMASGTIRYWAAARAAAGTAEEPYAGTTLGEVIDAARAARGLAFSQVLGHCTFLVDGVRSGPSTRLVDGGVIEVLPPFAGGSS
jgi:molybdopterin converting factor small subunit